jgi:cytoskeletal protein CcmA (bactofilin family)
MALFGRRQPGDNPGKPDSDTRDTAQLRPYPRPEALTTVTRTATPSATAMQAAAPSAPQPTMQPATPSAPAVSVDPTRRTPLEGITAPSGPAATIGAPARRTEERPAPSGDYDGKKLIVGKQIVLSGEIKACEKLVVEGKVEASLTDSHSIEILPDGLFKGTASIDVADISGRFEGDLVVRDRLTLRSTGHISGNVRYGEMQIERGGVIAGDMRPIDESDSVRLGSDSTDRPDRDSGHAGDGTRGD